MAVLDREKFLSTLQTLSGDDTSDDMLTIIADMTETYDSFNGSEAEKYKAELDEWKTKYEENDKEWRNKYKNAFFGQRGKDDDFEKPSGNDRRTQTQIRISDLFKKRED